jgi:fructose transport system ATP-binding protein
VAVARAATFGSKVIILDEPTAALGVRESARVLQLIHDLRDRGLPVILISHNMQQVFEVADRIHVQRLGRRAAVVTPQTHTMNDAVGIMTGALTVPEEERFPSGADEKSEGAAPSPDHGPIRRWGSTHPGRHEEPKMRRAETS